jgi:hypothetical protein
MTAVLTPDLAVRYLAELEPAIEALAILGADGVQLAGDPSLPAGRGTASEGLLTARGPRHVVIARVGPRALPELVRHDLEAVARELG